MSWLSDAVGGAVDTATSFVGGGLNSLSTLITGGGAVSPGGISTLGTLASTAGAAYDISKFNKIGPDQLVYDPVQAQRGQYMDQLKAFVSNPDISSVPGYKAGLEAVEDAGAAQGFTGGGNMATSLLKYGGSVANQWLQSLMQLAGFNLAPTNVSGGVIGAAEGSAGLLSAGLGNLGYLASGGSGSPGGGLGGLLNMFGLGGGGGGASGALPLDLAGGGITTPGADVFSLLGAGGAGAVTDSAGSLALLSL